MVHQVDVYEGLGKTLNPHTIEAIKEIRAPQSGWLFWPARSFAVRPGDWAFAVAPETGAGWHEQHS